MDNYTEYGLTGLNRQSGYIYEEFLPQLRYPQATKIYQEMSDNDPTIGAIMHMSKQLIRKAKWEVQPVGDTPIDKECAKFVEECMDDMSMSWSNLISEILSEFIYGWSYHEIVYKIRKGPREKNPKFKSKYTDGRIGWRKIPIRAQSTLYKWEFSEEGKLLGMWQQAPPNYELRYIPLEKSLLFRTETTRDNPEGRSMLRNAYRPWYFKKHIEEIEGIGIERDLAGLPVIKTPEGTDIFNPENTIAKKQKDFALHLVSTIRRDKCEGVVIPDGWELKLLSTGGVRQFDTNAIINRYDQRIAITMLADIVMLGADKVGSFALADVKRSLLAASLEAATQEIASIFNKYAIPKLIDLNNFPGITDYPILVPSEVEVPGLKELGEFLRATGLDVKNDYDLNRYIRSVASMPPVREEDWKKQQPSETKEEEFKEEENKIEGE